MNEKTQNALIILALFLGIIALLWTFFRNSPAIQYIESGQWLPETPLIPPLAQAGDIIIEAREFAPWSPQNPGTIENANMPGVNEKCGCGPVVCERDVSSFATYSSSIINAAAFSFPMSGNIYLGY